MLKKAMAEEGKNWDQLGPPITGGAPDVHRILTIRAAVRTKVPQHLEKNALVPVSHWSSVVEEVGGEDFGSDS